MVVSEPNCPFCKRIADAQYIFDYDGVVDFIPLNPVVEGHRLFVPTMHLANASVAPLWTSRVFEVAALFASLHEEDYNLITSCGVDATQTVLHLHVHYVPRRPDDGLHLPWTGQLDRQVHERT